MRSWAEPASRWNTGREAGDPSNTREGAPAIAFKDVWVEVPGAPRPLVRELTFSVARGERLALVGRSGAGKTTTLRLVNRLVEPTRGEIAIEGQRAADSDPIRLRRRIGYVIQDVGLLPHHDVETNVALVPRLEGWAKERIGARVHELLAMVGLEPAIYARRFPRELSGGQRQRVGVARALAADPPIVLMDEPFGALDPITRVELQREVVALFSKLEKTLVLVTHDLREAFAMATRVALFEDGALVVDAAPAAFRRSEHPEARAFLASLDEPAPRAEAT